MSRSMVALCAMLLVAGCGAPDPVPEPQSAEAHADDGIKLTAGQIAAAGIALARPTTAGDGGAIEAAALIEGDPDSTRIVAAPIEGRIVSLSGQLGERVSRGQILAVIESRAAATLQADVERARTRTRLADATRARDEALYARGFRPLREVEITRAAAEEAAVDLRMARQQLAAAGVRGGSLNRIAIASPIAGQVIARSALLGQTLNADNAGAELFRVADLDRLNVTLSLAAADAAAIGPGAVVEVTADSRSQQARVRFVSPVLDPETRLVRLIADLDNRAGRWRAGEPVRARVRIAGKPVAGGVLTVPAAAVQTVEGRPVLFVRTRDGFRVAPVTLGERDGAKVTVREGIAAGDRIAVANSFILKAELGKGDADHGEH